MYEPAQVISTTKEIREILGDVLFSQDTKVIDHIDKHCQMWIEHSTFAVISTSSDSGKVDVAPKGDPVGAYKVLDNHTIVIADRPGNNRADTFTNIIENPHVGLMFIVPGRREVVRVSGSAKIVKDPDLLATMSVNEKLPKLAIVIHVEEAMFHCGKAIVRSGLWTPEKWASIDGLPSYGQALVDHGKLSIPVDDMQEGVERHEVENLY
jgi:PPOX class probable FMN-dependent enzyme